MPRPSAVREATVRLALSPTLTHLLTVNGFFVALSGHGGTRHAAARPPATSSARTGTASGSPTDALSRSGSRSISAPNPSAGSQRNSPATPHSPPAAPIPCCSGCPPRPGRRTSTRTSPALQCRAG
jgi:hypothetical protein